jgi:aldehyde dehydrogenase (NAD+)
MLLDIQKLAEPETIEHAPLFFLGEKKEVRRVPFGVTLIVSAWNYPIHLCLAPFTGAIAGGNVSVLKFSEIAPHTAELMSKLIPKYMDSRTCRVVLGGIPEGQKLLEQKFNLICYTG